MDEDATVEKIQIEVAGHETSHNGEDVEEFTIYTVKLMVFYKGKEPPHQGYNRVFVVKQRFSVLRELHLELTFALKSVSQEAVPKFPKRNRVATVLSYKTLLPKRMAKMQRYFNELSERFGKILLEIDSFNSFFDVNGNVTKSERSMTSRTLPPKRKRVAANKGGKASGLLAGNHRSIYIPKSSTGKSPFAFPELPPPWTLPPPPPPPGQESEGESKESDIKKTSEKGKRKKSVQFHPPPEYLAPAPPTPRKDEAEGETDGTPEKDVKETEESGIEEEADAKAAEKVAEDEEEVVVDAEEEKEEEKTKESMEEKPKEELEEEMVVEEEAKADDTLADEKAEEQPEDTKAEKDEEQATEAKESVEVQVKDKEETDEAEQREEKREELPGEEKPERDLEQTQADRSDDIVQEKVQEKEESEVKQKEVEKENEEEKVEAEKEEEKVEEKMEEKVEKKKADEEKMEESFTEVAHEEKTEAVQEQAEDRTEAATAVEESDEVEGSSEDESGAAKYSTRTEARHTLLAIDMGSSEVRACRPDTGFAAEMEAVVGVPKKGGGGGMFPGNERTYVGKEALAPSRRYQLQVERPRKRGHFISSFSCAERLLQHIAFLQNDFGQTTEAPEILALAVDLPNRSDLRALCQWLHEDWSHQHVVGYERFCVIPQQVAVLSSLGVTTGVVVHIGEDHASVCVVYEGSVMEHTVQEVSVTGQLLTEHIRSTMSGEDLFFEIFQERVSEVHQERVAREFKEKYCHCERAEEKNTLPTHFGNHYSAVMSKRRTFWAMAAFAPDTVGAIGKPLQQCVADAVGLAPKEIREELWKNIVTTGGGTRFAGFADELLHKLKLMDSCTKFVRVTPAATDATIVGLSALANAYGEAFERRCLPTELDNEEIRNEPWRYFW